MKEPVVTSELWRTSL